MLNRLKFNAGTFFGGLGVLIALGTAYLTLSPANLTFTSSKPQSLLSIKSTANHRLELRVDENPVKEPFLTEIRIENTAFKPITPGAYTDEFSGYGKGLSIELVNKSCKILACDISAMKPENRAPIEFLVSTNDVGFNSVFIKPTGLNAFDSFELKIITDGDPKTVRLRGHIADCRIQESGNFDEQIKALVANSAVFIQAIGGMLAILWTLVFAALCYVVYLVVVVCRLIWAELTFDSRLQEHVHSVEQAQSLLASKNEFDSVARSLGLKETQDGKLRRALAKMLPSIPSEPASIVPSITSQTPPPVERLSKPIEDPNEPESAVATKADNEA